MNNATLPSPTLDTAAASRWPERTALHLLGFGLVAAVLLALPVAPTDLDRHQLPKELTVHATVWFAVLLARPRLMHWPARGLQAGLLLLLAGSMLSTAMATNPWLGLRATGLTLTACVAFLLAHHLTARHGPLLLGWAVIAAVTAAGTALAQAWGVESVLFARTRAPGGTLGNRNFVGHLGALVTPGLFILVLTVARRRNAVLAAIGVMVVLAVLLLTRSRAAWLGALAGGGITAIALLHAWRRGGLRLSHRRAALLPVAVIGAAILAFGIPNALQWRSDSPYRDTLVGVANFQEGSGRGRLTQYRRTLELAAAHPLAGVGPGNWPVRYGDVAPASDPSWTRGDVIPLNPWPSSDWMALTSERGLIGVLAVLLLATGLGWRGLRALEAGGPRGAAGAALLGTVAVIAVVGSFDALLLLPVPVLCTGMLLGGWLARADGTSPPPTARRGPWLTMVVLLMAAVTARSAQQVTAYIVAGNGRALSELRWAARIDPTSYPIRIALARREPCRRARAHIAAVERLAPTWPAVVAVRKRCGG
ncbi:MAG: O-antigen ligase family protein [Gemmatimonadales bacterium]|nr:O-antigen ligase family protein [Gemmatimonadales bacterium]